MQTNREPEGPVRCIVVATDFSDNSRVAFDRAREIAGVHQARLVVAHVIPEPIHPSVGFEGVPFPTDLDERALRETKTMLGEWAETAAKAGIAVEDRVLRGTPETGIVELANEVAADLIVTGTRGTTGFKHLLLGSVAEEVVRRAECRVLSVHKDDVSPIADARTVLVPTDFSRPAAAAVRAASALLPSDSRARFILLHAFFPAAIYGPALVPAATPPLLHKELSESVRRKLEDIAAPLRAEGKIVEVETRAEDSTSAILECAEKHEADLIAMGTRGLSKLKKLLLGSTTQRVVQHAKCPVLSLHAHDPGS